MNIQWFPGHMTKAIREMQQQIKLIDCVIYVLDARAIKSSQNPEFDKIIENKPILFVINKIDKVEKSDLVNWERYFKNKKLNAIFINATVGKKRQEIVDSIKRINKEKIDRYKEKGINKTIRVLVIGMPNTGKSTIINTLKKEKKASVSNRPGVTRAIQWVRIDENIELFDTPGTLMPSFEDSFTAIKLAFIGSIGDAAFDIVELSLELINYLLTYNKQLLESRYSIDIANDASSVKILEQICQSKGFLLKGSEYDYERCANALIKDFRDCKIAKIMFDFV